MATLKKLNEVLLRLATVLMLETVWPLCAGCCGSTSRNQKEVSLTFYNVRCLASDTPHL